MYIIYKNNKKLIPENKSLEKKFNIIKNKKELNHRLLKELKNNSSILNLFEKKKSLLNSIDFTNKKFKFDMPRIKQKTEIFDAKTFNKIVDDDEKNDYQKFKSKYNYKFEPKLKLKNILNKSLDLSNLKLKKLQKINIKKINIKNIKITWKNSCFITKKNKNRNKKNNIKISYSPRNYSNISKKKCFNFKKKLFFNKLSNKLKKIKKNKKNFFDRNNYLYQCIN